MDDCVVLDVVVCVDVYVIDVVLDYCVWLY